MRRRAAQAPPAGPAASRPVGTAAPRWQWEHTWPSQRSANPHRGHRSDRPHSFAGPHPENGAARRSGTHPGPARVTRHGTWVEREAREEIATTTPRRCPGCPGPPEKGGGGAGHQSTRRPTATSPHSGGSGLVRKRALEKNCRPRPKQTPGGGRSDRRKNRQLSIPLQLPA